MKPASRLVAPVAELVVYSGMHYGGWDPEFERDYLERVVAWFDKYLK
jgi:hypothetical protein